MKWIYLDAVERLVSDVQGYKVYDNPFRWMLENWYDGKTRPSGSQLVDAANDTFNLHMQKFLIQDFAFAWTLAEWVGGYSFSLPLNEDVVKVLHGVTDMLTVGVPEENIWQMFVKYKENDGLSPTQLAQKVKYTADFTVEEHEEALERLYDTH